LRLVYGFVAHTGSGLSLDEETDLESRARLIKCDVEGAELLVLHVARTLLAEHLCEAFILARYPSMAMTART